MIQIEITKRKDRIRKLTCRGHAGFADRGSDLVCAGISSILFGALNGLDEMFAADVKLKADDNCIEIDVCNDSDLLFQVLGFIQIQLQTVEEMYSEFVRIVQKEV